MRSRGKTRPRHKTNGAAAPQLAQRAGYLAVIAWKRVSARQVVRGVSIYVAAARPWGLLGPNGAGKTTVFYMITGLIKAGSRHHRARWHDVPSCRCISAPGSASVICPGSFDLRGLTVEQNIRAVLEWSNPQRRSARAELIRYSDEFNIARLRKTPSIALSGGERRARDPRSLADPPQLMLLDEPFAGIDPIAVGDIQDLVRHLTNRGIGVLITDHNVRKRWD